MNKIVVTGATGFVGSHLIKELSENKNNYIYAVVRPNSTNKKMLTESDNVKFIDCSLELITQLPKLISDKVDIFYHLAWGGVRGDQRNDSNIQILNYQYSIDAINTAGKLGSKAFIGLGSQAEYGFYNEIITETTPATPTTEYGIAKLRTCLDGQIVAEGYRDMRYIWPRLFSAYGPGDFEGTMIMSVLQKMLRNENIFMASSCTQLWDYLYISDLVSMLIELQAVPSGIYNLASGESRMLKDFIEDMADVTEFKGSIAFGNQNAGGLHPSINKLLNAGVNKPRIVFREGIKQIISTINI